MNLKKLFVPGFVLFAAACHLASAAVGYTDEKLGLVFPARIGKAEFRGVNHYPDRAAGYWVHYTSAEWNKLDVYVYDEGISKIPNGCESAEVSQQLTNVGAEVEARGRLGHYRYLRKLQTDFWPGEKRRLFRHSSYEYAQNKGPNVSYEGTRCSETFITGGKGNFIKIRCTYWISHAEEGADLARQTASAMAAMLRLPEESGAEKSGSKTTR